MDFKPIYGDVLRVEGGTLLRYVGGEEILFLAPDVPMLARWGPEVYLNGEERKKLRIQTHLPEKTELVGHTKENHAFVRATDEEKYAHRANIDIAAIRNGIPLDEKKTRLLNLGRIIRAHREEMPRLFSEYAPVVAELGKEYLPSFAVD